LNPIQSGVRVRLIDNPGRQGITTGRHKQAGSFTLVEVDFGPNEKQFKRLELLELVEESIEPFDQLEAGRFGTPQDLQRALTFEKIKGELTNVFYSMEASNTTFYAHQFKPVMRFIESPNGRLLIADEVGLGKTIEATYVWKELQARHSARRLLVVCPAMLRQKWQEDLQKRFNISADIVTSRDVLSKVEQLAAHKRPDSFVWITSLEGIRAPAQFENESLSGTRAKLARLLDQNVASAEYSLFDHVIIDEAHYLRNPSTGNHRIGRLLAEAAGNLLLLTATPIQLGSDNLYQLLRLVDPETFYDATIFGEMLAANGHIVRAQRALWRQPPSPPEAVSAISTAVESDYFRNDPVLDQIKSDLSESSITTSERVSLLRRLESRSLLSQYMTRSRKREVLEKRVERAPQVLNVTFNPRELEIYNHVTLRIREQAAGQSGASLFPLITRQRQMASSIIGALEGWRERGVIDELLWEDFGRPATAAEPDDQEAADARNAALVGQSENAPIAFGFNFDMAALEADDGKYRALAEFLTGELAKNDREKFIVFAFYRGTLKYLARRLKADGIRASILMGGMVEPKDDIVRGFAESGGPSVLLSSEIGSEGIDLQFCRFVINYDLPWNPMKVEQRIGRIDRLGQEAERISIVSLYVSNTIEDRVLMRLYERINVFRESIGDLEEILGEVTEKMIIDLLDPSLSDAERERRAATSELAAHNTQMEQKKLEEEAINLIGFSDYILEHIRDSRRQGRWLGAAELMALVEDFFARNYPGTQLERDEASTTSMRILLSSEARRDLAYFVEDRKLGVHTRLHQGQRALTCIFDTRQVARLPRNAEIVEPSHPLVQWIRAKYERDPGHIHRVSAVGVDAAQTTVPSGDYAFSVHLWSFLGWKSEHLLAFSACNTSITTMLDGPTSEQLVNLAARAGRVVPNALNVLPSLPVVCRSVLLCEKQLTDAFGQRLQEAEAENVLHCDQQETSAQSYARRRLSDLRGRLIRFKEKGNARAIPMTEGLVRKAEEELESKLVRIGRRRQIDATMVPLALGLIRVE
jgi:SNF2 family DNA or RNA helicase